MLRIVTSIVVCLHFCVLNARACGYTVKINIVETHNFDAVYPAVVFIEPLNRLYETDSAGNITIDSLCEGTYIVHFQAAGYVPKTDSFSISGNRTVRLKVAYKDHQLQQITVKEERTRTILQSKDQLNKQDIAARSGKSLGDLLQTVNGVSTLDNGATIVKPVIHGLHSNRIVLVNNGIRQEDQQWGAEHAPNIDPFLANAITVVKGAAGVRYGTDAIGGVVLVDPAPLRQKPGWGGEVNLAGFSNNRMGVASAMLEHNLRKIPALSFRVQATYKQGGNYRIPDHWAANTGIREGNYSAGIGYRKPHSSIELFYSRFNTDLGIYRGSHTGNEQDFLNAINSAEPLIPATFTYDIERPKQHVLHDLIKGKLYADSRIGIVTVVYGFQHNFRQEYDVIRKENGKAQLNLTLNTQTINANVDHKKIGGISGQFGVDGGYQDNFFRDGDRLFIPTYTSIGNAAYLIERYTRSNWQLEAGARYDYKWYGVYNPDGKSQTLVYHEFDYHNISGTLGFQQKLNTSWQWSVTLANAWRAPQASELFSAGMHHGAARIEIGNKDLLPERSYSLNAETRYDLNNKLKTEISVYSQVIDDYIYLEPGPDLLTIRGFFKTFNYTQTNAWLNGSDISLHYQWNDHWETALKAAILRARDRTKDDWLILMPSDRLVFNCTYTSDLSKTLQKSYAGLDAKYVFRQTRIPSDFDLIDFPRPPAGYFLLDAVVGTQVRLNNKTIDVSLTVTNLLNRKYRDYMDAFRYFINQPGTNAALRIRMPF